MTVVWEQFRSPCCRKPLEPGGGVLGCMSCNHAYGIESYGPDLMPPSIESRYESYATWRSVQEALSNWRKRTWDGSTQAKERTRSNELMGEEFIARFSPRGGFWT